MQAAEAKCERLLYSRDRSSGELRQRLLGDGFPAEVVDLLVKRLVRVGLVDDERFCRLYIESKRKRGWGRHRIAMGLKALGVDVSDHPELAQGLIDLAGELGRALDALKRYRGRVRDGYAGRARYLAAKGFDASTIHQALRCWQEGIGD
jgi:regulatory protein